MESTKDFLGDPVERNPLVNAEDMGSMPGPGRPHAPQSSSAPAPPLLSLCSRARELQLLKPECPELVLCNKRSPPSRSPCNEE